MTWQVNWWESAFQPEAKEYRKTQGMREHGVLKEELELH